MDARPKASEIKKYLMWSKINELKREGHSISKIKLLTGYDRKTIRKYLGMSEEEFRSRGCCVRVYPSRLDKYRPFIKKRLENYHFLSSAAIHAQLRREYRLEKFNQKTVYNYVGRSEGREYPHGRRRHRPSLPYAGADRSREYAQADFGEKWIDHKKGGKKKVYFFVLLLSRWRHKFVWFSDVPFTSELAAYAHELGFEFFGGVPHNIVYDQDKVLISNENMGDYILTQRFRTLVRECGFNPIFCRKADPESKGKVENVVKYVKHNFLAVYEFKSVAKLNSDCQVWLDTTANGIPHATTGMIPSAMFEQEEKSTLLPYNGVPTPPRQELPTYVLRKDNTISYKGNYYAVPIGSYTGQGSSARVLEKDGIVEIYSVQTGKLLMRHHLETEKGKLVSNTACRRNPDSRIESLEKSVLDWFAQDSIVKTYLNAVRKAFPRNIRDNFFAIEQNMLGISQEAMTKAMTLHLEVSKPGVNAMLQTARTIEKKDGVSVATTMPDIKLHTLTGMPDMTPARTSMTTYSAIFN